MTSPLGKYAPIVAAAMTILIILAALFQHVFHAGTIDAFLDDLAILAVGIVFGTAGSLTRLNGTVAKVDEHEAKLSKLTSELASNTISTDANTAARAEASSNPL